MASVSFVVHGEPVAQGRPKFTTRGGFARAYDPPKSKHYKQTVACVATEAMNGREPFKGACNMLLRAFFAMPKSMHRRRTPTAATRKTTKPDISNVVKGVEDAISGIVYEDDNLLYSVAAEKWWAAQGEQASVQVSVWEEKH